MKEQIEPPRISPTIAIIFGILAVSTSSIFIRFAQETASSIVIAAFRLSLATLIMVPFAMNPANRRRLKTLTRKEIFLGLLSGIFLALHFATWISSLAYTTVASSVVLGLTGILFGVALARLEFFEGFRGNIAA